MNNDTPTCACAKPCLRGIPQGFVYCAECDLWFDLVKWIAVRIVGPRRDAACKEHGWTFQCGSKGSVCTDCGDDTEDESVFVKGTDYLCCQCAKVGMNIYCQDITEQALHIKGLEASIDSLKASLAARKPA